MALTRLKVILKKDPQYLFHHPQDQTVTQEDQVTDLAEVFLLHQVLVDNRVKMDTQEAEDLLLHFQAENDLVLQVLELDLKASLIDYIKIIIFRKKKLINRPISFIIFSNYYFLLLSFQMLKTSY